MDRLPPSLASTGKHDMSTPHATTVSSNPASPSTFHPTSPKDEVSGAPLLNIQFHIASVHGLPLASSFILTRRLIKRVVHVSCTGAHDAERSTDAVAEADSIWDENLEQIGPVVSTDKIKFSIEEHAPWPLKRGMTMIATSKEYTVDALLVLQGKRGEKKSISIPLKSDHDGSIDATLLLRVQEPTTDFVSKQWKEDAEKLEQRREVVNLR